MLQLMPKTADSWSYLVMFTGQIKLENNWKLTSKTWIIK